MLLAQDLLVKASTAWALRVSECVGPELVVQCSALYMDGELTRLTAVAVVKRRLRGAKKI